jgi:hypothetical protein
MLATEKRKEKLKISILKIFLIILYETLYQYAGMHDLISTKEAEKMQNILKGSITKALII